MIRTANQNEVNYRKDLETELKKRATEALERTSNQIHVYVRFEIVLLRVARGWNFTFYSVLLVSGQMVACEVEELAEGMKVCLLICLLFLSCFNELANSK